MSLHLQSHAGPLASAICSCTVAPDNGSNTVNWEERCRALEAALAYQCALTRAETLRAESAEGQLASLRSHQPPPEIAAAATMAAQGGVVFVHRSTTGKWEFHNPTMVPIDTAARHLDRCTRTVKRLAKKHGIPISQKGGPHINLRKLTASIEEAAR